MSKYVIHIYVPTWTFTGYRPDPTYGNGRAEFNIDRLAKKLSVEREKTGLLCYVMLADRVVFRRLQQKAHRIGARLFSMPQENGNVIAISNTRISLHSWGQNAEIDGSAWVEISMSTTTFIGRIFAEKLFSGGKQRLNLGRSHTGERGEAKKSSGIEVVVYSETGTEAFRNQLEAAGFGPSDDIENAERIAEYARGANGVETAFVRAPDPGVA